MSKHNVTTVQCEHCISSHFIVKYQSLHFLAKMYSSHISPAHWVLWSMGPALLSLTQTVLAAGKRGAGAALAVLLSTTATATSTLSIKSAGATSTTTSHHSSHNCQFLHWGRCGRGTTSLQLAQYLIQTMWKQINIWFSHS
jgi:hypothetical protein